MKFFTRAIAVLAFTAPGIVSAADEEHHGHHTCACEAEEFDFTIDCSEPNPMLEALALLVENDCSTDCSSDLCFRNFLIIQSHHDFCLRNEVPETVESNFHDYEEVCDEHCMISRRIDPALSLCPEPRCDNSGDDAYQVLLTNNCLSNCTSETCITNYQILISEHDNCPDTTLSPSAETGLHDLEEVCTANDCNSLRCAEAEAAQTVCTEDSTDPCVGGTVAPTAESASARLFGSVVAPLLGLATLFA